MRYIKKNPEPPELVEWKELTIPTEDTPFDSLGDGIDANSGKSVKQIVKECLSIEQGHICCYCEQQITSSPIDKHPYHIEHYKPKSKFPKPEYKFNYGNFGASCMGGQDKDEKKITRLEKKNLLHCGHKKDEEILPLLPIDDGCEDYLDFMDDGIIEPSRNPDLTEKAEQVIDILNLNSSRLIVKRKKVIKYLKEKFETVSKDEVVEKLRSLQTSVNDGVIEPFISTQVHFLQSLIQ